MAHHCFLVALAVLASLWSPIAALYEGGDAYADVKPIADSAEFEAAILGAPGAAVVQFYFPDSPAAEAFAPEYKRLAKSLGGIATVAAVDCSHEGVASMCAQAAGPRTPLKAAPLVRLYAPDVQRNPYTGGLMKDQQVYGGASTARDLSRALTALLHARHLTRLASPSDLEAFLAANTSAPHALLFTSKAEPTSLIKGLSCALGPRMPFAEVHESASELVDKYSVTEFPTVLVVQADGQVQQYEGELKGPPLRAWLEPIAPPFQPPAGGGEGGAAEPGRPGGAAGGAMLPELTVANLTDLDAKEDMHLVAFYGGSDEECSGSLGGLFDLVKDFLGVIEVGRLRVGASDLSKVKRFGVDTAGLMPGAGCRPQLVLLPWGEDKGDLEEYERYDGDMTDGKALYTWVLDKIPDLTQPLLDEASLAAFTSLVANAPEDEPLGQVILLTNKAEVPPMFRALAMAAQKHANLVFGWARLEEGSQFARRVKDQLKATKVPHLSLMALYNGKEAPPPSAKGRKPIASQPYQGPMKLQPLMSWVVQLSVMLDLVRPDSPLAAARRLRGAAGGEGDPHSPRGAGAAAAGPMPVPEAASQADFAARCTEAGGICVVALLDGAAGDLQQRVRETEAAGGAHAGQPINFVWVDAARQPTLREAFGVSREQLPTAAAFSARRMRYALCPPPFSEASLKKLVSGVLTGGSVTVPLQQLPTVVDGGEDQGDQQAGGDLAEEELDLADIMGEEVGALRPSKEELIQQADAELAAKQEAAKAAKKGGSKKKKGKKRKEEL